MNTLFADYAAHIERSKAQGFRQVSFTQFIAITKEQSCTS